jgi:methylase of polypeptide subunit release factors
MAMECGEDQANDILSIFVDKAEKGRVIKDSFGHNRVVVIKR